MLPTIVNHLIGITGLQTGDKKDVSVTYPADFKTPDLQETVDFNIEVVEVRERKLPELTDELAQKIDKDCKTVKEWKAKLTDEINARFETENKKRLSKRYLMH